MTDIQHTGTLSGDMGTIEIELANVLPLPGGQWGTFERKRCCPEPFPDWIAVSSDTGTRILIECQSCQSPYGAISFGRLSTEHEPLTQPR